MLGWFPKEDLRNTEDRVLLYSVLDPALPPDTPLQAHSLQHPDAVQGMPESSESRGRCKLVSVYPCTHAWLRSVFKDKEGKDGGYCLDLGAQHSLPLNATD